MIIVTQEAAIQRVGLTVRFGSVVPAQIMIETYAAGERVEHFQIDEIVKDFRLDTEFEPFDTMHIRFTRTAKPYQPVEVEFLKFEKVSEFVMDKSDMTSYPVSTNEKSVRRIDTVISYYNDTEENDTLFSEEVTVENAGEEQEFYMNDASYGYSASIESGQGCTIIASGAYYVRVRFAVAGTYKLNVTGRRYNVTTSTHSLDVQQRGEVKTWENPLVGDMTMAKNLTEWLAAYYKNNIIYEYDTRGFPELDPNDVIYQESKYVQDMQVRITEHVVRFNGSLSGRLTTRRVK